MVWGQKGKPALKLPSDENKIAYMAALVDGEGSIKLAKSGGCTVEVSNTSVLVMDWLSTNFGGHMVTSIRAGNRKRQYRWSVCRQLDSLVLLKAILPFLTIKREKAELMITEIYRRWNLHFPGLVEWGLLPRVE